MLNKLQKYCKNTIKSPNYVKSTMKKLVNMEDLELKSKYCKLIKKSPLGILSKGFYIVALFHLIWMSCAINSTQYRYFCNNFRECSECCTCSNSCSDTAFYEIKADYLKEKLQKQNHSLVVTINLTCKGSPLIFEQWNKTIINDSVNLFFVFFGFDLNNLKKICSINSNLKFYFASHKYGNNLPLNEKRFVYELTGFKLKNNIVYLDTIDWYFFQNQKLIAKGFGHTNAKKFSEGYSSNVVE